jgi:hypothetical protein
MGLATMFSWYIIQTKYYAKFIKAWPRRIYAGDASAAQISSGCPWMSRQVMPCACMDMTLSLKPLEWDLLLVRMVGLIVVWDSGG